MYYLHASNRTENLLEHLTEVIRVDKQSSLFSKELFLIQSQGMERMIAQVLADRFRSFCNFGFFLPLDFLNFIAIKLDSGITPDGYQRHILAWRLDELLRDISAECYTGLRYYLSGENGSLKRFQLAVQLAHIFDQYQVMRPDMLVLWERGRRATTHPEEDWQKDLWQRLIGQQGGEIHRGLQFRRLITLLNSSRDFSAVLPRRISVVGLHIMAPIFQEFLMSLSRHLDVHLFLLSPCRHYWGDLDNKRRQLKREIHGIHQGDKTPFLPVTESHPLLTVLGKQGRDFQKMMLENVDFQMEFESFIDPLEADSSDSPTLLHRLQSDLLNGEVQAKSFSLDSAADDSIQIVSCHSKLREIGVLKDHLLRLLHYDSSLALRDIIIMAPNIQEYGSLIPAIFDDIQHSIADRSLQKRNSTLSAFLDFLHLFKGRFGWSEVLDVLRHPVVYPHFQLSAGDLDTIQNWVLNSGIRWGLSEDQREDAGLPPFPETSWRAGLDRMLMGFAIDTDKCIGGVLPFTDIEGRGAHPLGGLCSFIEVIERAYYDFKRSYPLEKWSTILSSYADLLLGENDEKERADLRAMLADLGESLTHFHASAVDFDVLLEWFEQSAKESRSSAGFLRGQLTFCSMLPMRSIPFKVVCLLGLNEGVFPKNDNHATFDIMGSDFRCGDRSPRADDRYQFLEAILAARNHFYLSYIGQSIKTNEKIAPSVVLTEFLEAIESGYGIKDMIVHHPLHPFSPRYFDVNEESSLFSYNKYYCQTAEMLQQDSQPAEIWWKGRLKQDFQTLLFSDLHHYFRNPQRWFVRNCLGIRLNNDEILPEDSEIFQTVGLEKYYVEQELIAWELKGRPDNILQRLQLEGRWLLGAPGKVFFDKTMAELTPFVDVINDQRMGLRLADQQLDFELAGYHVNGILENRYENGVMLIRYGDLRGRDVLVGWLHHLVLRRLSPSSVTRIVTKNRVISFSSLGDGPSLETMVDHFVEGCEKPSSLFVEPAFAYIKQTRGGSVRVSPKTKAITSFQRSIDSGYEPEWKLLYGGTEDIARLFNENFLQQCESIMDPVWSRIDE